MVATESFIESLLAEKLAGASAGNARAAAIAAALIHRYPVLAKRQRTNIHYDGLLSQVLFSGDAELTVCVAEELAKGKNLVSNPSLVQQFFDRAEKLSPFMGAYVLGSLLAPIDRGRAIELFARAEKAGHVPSAIRKHRTLAKKIPVVGRVVGLFLGLYDFILTWVVIRKGDRLNERFWRYRDVFPTPLEPIDEKMGAADRANIFSEVEDLEACANQPVIGSELAALNHTG